MKPNKFFEVFEITVISGSLILIFFLFFFKEQKLTVLIYILQYIKENFKFTPFLVKFTPFLHASDYMQIKFESVCPRV